MIPSGPGDVDPIGAKALAQSVQTVIKGLVDGATAVLGRICLPAAEEVGLLLKDRVSYWRACNVASITKKLEQKLAQNKVPENAHAHPRLVHKFMEEGSWVDDALVQDMWAGLLSSSCTEEGDDDSNLVFTNILSQLTKLEAKILRLACERAEKEVSTKGFVFARPLMMNREEFPPLVEESDIQRLDRELDHLRTMGLLTEHAGFSPEGAEMNLTPAALALHMYTLRGQEWHIVKGLKLMS
jgi:hypothetical protein